MMGPLIIFLFGGQIEEFFEKRGNNVVDLWETLIYSQDEDEDAETSQPDAKTLKEDPKNVTESMLKGADKQCLNLFKHMQDE